MDQIVSELKNALSQEFIPEDESPYARASLALDIMMSVDRKVVPEGFSTLVSYTSRFLEEYRNDVRRAWVSAARNEVVENLINPVAGIKDFLTGVSNDVIQFKSNLVKSISYLSGNESDMAKELLLTLETISEITRNKEASIESQTPMLSYKKDIDKAPIILEKMVGVFEAEAERAQRRKQGLENQARDMFHANEDVNADDDHLDVGKTIKIFCDMMSISKDIEKFDPIDPLSMNTDGVVIHPVALELNLEQLDALKEITRLFDLSNRIDKIVPITSPSAFTALKKQIVDVDQKSFEEFLDRINPELSPDGDPLDRLDRCFGIEFIHEASNK